jgi:hypothetical protein
MEKYQYEAYEKYRYFLKKNIIKKYHINNAKIIDIILYVISQINSFNNKEFLGIENPPTADTFYKKI